ncbi:MAG: AI-2E family transporter [Acidimicrobiales bacterium]
MEETGLSPSIASRWDIPSWYRRVGLGSWLFLGIVAAIVLFSVLIAATSDIIAPSVLGAFMAIAFLPVVDWITDRGLNRAIAAGMVVAGLVVGGIVLGWVIGSAIAGQADELTANLDSAVADIKDWTADSPVSEDVIDNIRETAGEAGTMISSGLAGRAVSVIDSAFGIVTGLILGAVVLYYLLKDFPQVASGRFENVEDEEERAMFQRIGQRTVDNVQNYFRGRTAMAMVNGVAIGLAAAVLGVPAAIAIAVVNFVGAYIPYLGAFVGGAFAVLMALGEGGFGLALVVLAISLAVNLLLENLLEPRLLGDTMDLHPLLILLATSLGGLIAGMIGLVLAAPAVAIAIDVKNELKSMGFFDDD